MLESTNRNVNHVDVAGILLKEVQDLPGVITLKQGTVYPILSFLTSHNNAQSERLAGESKDLFCEPSVKRILIGLTNNVVFFQSPYFYWLLFLIVVISLI